MAALAPTREISTRERIMAAGRLRFNADGLQAAAMYRVAADLGISPGNLSYHFRNKPELAITLANELEREMATVTKPSRDPPDARGAIRLVERVITLLWRYRFLFNSAHHLAGLDERLAKRCRQLQQTLRALIRRNAESMIAIGAMRVPRPDLARIIADNIVAIWLSWLALQELSEHATADAPSGAMLRDCLEHHFGLLEPYLSRAFLAELDRALAERHGDTPA